MMAGKNKKNFLWWAVFHIALFVAFGISAIRAGGVRVDADFLNMLPDTSKSKALRAADAALSKNATANAFILVGNADFAEAKSVAEEIFAKLDGADAFESVSMSADIAEMGDVRDFLRRYKYAFLSESARANIAADAEGFAENALSAAFGFSLLGLDDIESDPFMLAENTAAAYLAASADAGVAMSAKDGVLATQYEGVWYVMIRALLSEKGARLAGDSNAVPLIERVCEPFEARAKIVYYGTPFHSYKSASSAEREIKAIGAVCTLAVLLMLAAVFRSAVPIAFSMFSIALSIAAAVAATHAVFGEIHTLALVFGTSLVGSSIDYSLHFFINWKANRALKSGAAIRERLFTGLTLSLVSTEICYALLFFAPFALVKQMAVFSFAGILSTFLTATGFFPLLPLPRDDKRRIAFIGRFTPKIAKARHFSTAAMIALAVLCAAVIGCKRANVRIENNISALYKMEGRLKDDTILAYKILRYSPASYLIVAGESAEEVLEKEERLCAAIAARGEDGFVATTRFIPSLKSQAASIASSDTLLDLLPQQHDALGFDAESSARVREDFTAAREDFFRIDEDFEDLPATLKSILSSLWLGEVDGKYYSATVPSTISDSAFYADLAREEDGVFFESKVSSISAGLDELTAFIVKIFCAAYIVIFVVLRFFYGWRDTLKIAAVPLLSASAVVAVFALLGQKIEFFSVTGMILVFGLGLDYIIYSTQHRESAEERAAIVLSFLTTAMSFGALALSSFVPVHVLGLSILTGLSAAFLCTQP